MAIQKIQAGIGYQLMTIMVSTIKAHHLTGGSLPLTALATAAATPGCMCSVATAYSTATLSITALMRFAP